MNDKWHRTDGPARIFYHKNGNIQAEEYYMNGDRHRTDGPAMIWYYDNGNIKSEEYYMNDKRHRLDGPAVIKYSKSGRISREYWVNGEHIIDPKDKKLLQTPEGVTEFLLKY